MGALCAVRGIHSSLDDRTSPSADVERKRPLRRRNGYAGVIGLGHALQVNSYRSLSAWKRAHQALIVTLRSTDAAYHPRARNLFDQLRRAVISVEANIVEGYALNTPALCRRHLRIAIGSAAEAECMLRAAGELSYLPEQVVSELGRLLDLTLGALHGLVRSPPVTESRSITG